MAKQKQIGMIALGAVFCLLLGASSFAATVNVSDRLIFSAAAGRSSDSSWVGGAFHVQDINSEFGWDTFCLEKNEYINFGGTFIVTNVGPSAISGGLGNSNTHGAINNSGTGSDLISSQTAFLYYKYATGGLGFTGPGDAAQQRALQNVFWFLENEISSLPGGGDPYGYLALANTAVDGQFYNVAVVNPVFATVVLDHSYTPAQSQLVYIPNPVPEPGTMMLLGSGLVGLAGWGRKKFRK